MSESEIIVKHVLEGSYDEFDPKDYIQSAKNRESAVEIYNGPLVRVIQPLAAFTINNYLPDHAAWDEKYYQSIAQAGAIYLAVDKADHDNLVIFQPSSNNAWNGEGKQVDFKEIAGLISSKPESKFDDQDNKNWLDLQQGLATFFMTQIAKKKNVGQWVKYLTMIGRTDLATNYARYLGRAKLPFGKSIDAVMAMKKAGKRSRNRIARLMKNQQDVKWGESGFWLLFKDWEDLAPFYGEDRNHDYAKNAKQIFKGDAYEWFDNSDSKPEDVWDRILDKNMSVIRQLLVNRTVYNSDGEEHLVTRENIAELDDSEIKDIVCDRGNKGNECDDIYNAIRFAANDAYTSQQEAAYSDGYRNALIAAWGLDQDKTIKWINVGKKAKDKKLGGGMVQQGDQKTMLGLWFPYSTLEHWIAKWKEDEYEDDFYGDVHELAAAYLEKVEPDDEYFGDTDDEYFNDQLEHHLSELDLTAPPKQTDPNQPELPLQGEPAAQAGEIDKPYTVQVGNEPDANVYKHVNKSEATKYRNAMKPTRDDITFRAESFLAIPFNRLDEIDPKAFAQRVPLFYVLAWEWEPGKVMYLGRPKEGGDAAYQYEATGAMTLKFESAEEAKAFLSSAQWGTPQWGVERPFSVTPIYLNESRLEEREGDHKIELEVSDEAAESLVPLFKELKKMGDQGSSRSVQIDDWEGRSSFGFDGDGNSKIREIKVNGKVVEAQQLDEAVYKLSTTQIDLPKEIAGHIIQWGELNVADDDLYIDEKDGCGRETEQHVTVLYGLTEPSPSETLTKIVETTKPFLIEFAGVSIFENEKYDVIKIGMVSEELTNLHQQLRKACPNQNKFPDYQPHCTIAYVKKGLGKKYAGQDVFKAATVPRDFWAYDLLFKGAGDSEDAERVVQLIHFDKSKPIEEPDEPEAGEQRYPEATEEEPELAVAESAVDPKSFLAAHEPSMCPGCRSENISQADEEGLVDCFDCGIWFDPLHPENQPVRESDEVDPKAMSAKSKIDPHPDWQVIDRAEDKNGRIKVLYRHKHGRVFFKLINDFFGDDTPAYAGMLNDWSVYAYGGEDGNDFLDGEDFKAGSFEEAETTATNIAFTLIHSTSPSYLQPRRVRPGQQQEAEEINAKEFLNRTTKYRVRLGAGAQTRYLNQDLGTGQLKWMDFEDATVFDSDQAGEMVDHVGEVYGGQPVIAELVDDGHGLGESDEIDPKALSSRVLSNRYVLRSKRHQRPSYIVVSDGRKSRLGSSEFDNIRLTTDIGKATTFNFPDAQRWCEVYIHFEPVQVQDGIASPGHSDSALESVSEKLNGPFEDDGLPGEVTTFLRLQRGRARKARKAQTGRSVL